MSERYFYPVPGGRWASSFCVLGRWIHLIQDSRLYRPGDAEEILRALNIPNTQENLNLYFPERKGKGRCPTLDLLELCHQYLDPSGQQREVGV